MAVTLRPKIANDLLVVEHGIRGVGLQVRLRGVLVVFALVTVLWEPPQSYAALCQSLAVAYLLWALAVAVWFRRNPPQLVSLGWLILTVDLLLFGTLNQLAGVSNRISWTAYILVAGFTMIPLLAAAQLRPRLGIMVGAAATALYLLSSVSARQWNGTPGTDGEPWSSVILRTFIVAGIALAAVLLTLLQRSRVADIGRLAAQRADLLDQLRQLADRQRRELAEALHDGALQYLLGARLDLEDARETGSSAAFDRIDEALTTSTRLLRSTVSQLHPAVLEQAGLAQALRDLAADTQIRMNAGRPKPGRREGVSIAPPDDVRRDPADLALYSAVREMLSNVVKHSQAQHVSIELRREQRWTRVTVIDDGVGIPAGRLEQQLTAGHIGVASHRVRIEAAGGTLTLTPNTPHGTVASVTIPPPS